MELIQRDQSTLADRPRGDNRQVLRQATRGVHNAAETSWVGLGTKDFPIKTFLSVMHRVHRSFGLAAAQRCALKDAQSEEVLRITALEQDLSLTGTVKDHAQTSAIASRDAAWGVLYALNGSALGASLLLRSSPAAAVGATAYLTVMHDYARSGRLKAFFATFNSQDLNLSLAESGARAVFAGLTLD